MMLEKALELAAPRTQQAEAFLYRARSTPVEFRSSRLKNVETVENEVLCLRVIADGRLGISVTTKASEPESLVEAALAIAAEGREATFDFQGPGAAAPVAAFSSEIESLPVERMVETGQELIDALRQVDESILGMATVEKAIESVEMARSLGMEHSYSRTLYSVIFGGELVEGKNFLQVYDMEMRTDTDLDVEGLKGRILEGFRHARSNAQISSGQYPVILTPMALQFLLMRYGAALNGTAVEKQVSPWTGKLGQKVLDSRVTIHDQPDLAGAAGSVPVDDEGTPARKKPLIKEGILENYLLNLSSASALSLESTGNGFRSKPLLNSPPRPGPSNVVLEPGETPLRDMIASVDDGVLVDHLMGAWAGNPYSGEVNGNISLGYRIQGGEITGRVKDAMFSVNAFEALSEQLGDFSKERRLAMGKGLLPHVLLQDVNISAGG